MRTAIVGHRGVGKSSLLKRVGSYYRSVGREVLLLDLDHEIEKRSGESVSDIFARDGEVVFREIERRVFAEIDKETANETRDVFLVLGGGFDPSLLSENWSVLWVRRTSDNSGRVFLDRPRLNKGLTSAEEYVERYRMRQPRFASRADEVLWLDEGLETEDEAERFFFLNRRFLQESDSSESSLKTYAHGQLGAVSVLMQASLTLLPENLKTEEAFKRWSMPRLHWGLRWFELRDDLLSPEQMAWACQYLPEKQILMSFRDPSRTEKTRSLVLSRELSFDWPLERGECSWGEPRILSLHERREGESITEALQRFSALQERRGSGALTPLFKAALPTLNFLELEEGHRWQAQDRRGRVFLPLSCDGRWAWYRLWQGARGDDASSDSVTVTEDRTDHPFFIREGDGSGADQPTLLQWVRMKQIKNSRPSLHDSSVTRFAAILGSPVHHSRTPIEQRDHFASAHHSVFAISIAEDEWSSALPFLQELGLRWAAVTAPHKEKAYQLCGERDHLSESLKSVNTLSWDETRGLWRGTNTDLEGFRLAVEDVLRLHGDLGAVVVWGGGGTLPVVRQVLPQAQLFSARSGVNREATDLAKQAPPTTVIWAVGSSRCGLQDPPAAWRPRLVIDLNYAEDSPGRTYAMDKGAIYVSGLSMFQYQAKAQQLFWQLP